MKLSYEQAQIMMSRNHGSLDLSGTGITSLPDNLTVGDGLDLSDTPIPPSNVKPHRLKNGDYKEGQYLYANGILTHVKKKKTFNGYTYFLGKIPNKNVIFDGIHYAHCTDFRTGMRELEYKAACDRGAEQYRNLPLDTEMSVDKLVTMYRVITGACQQGSQAFVESLGDKLKERYTIQEAIALTEGQYGAKKFAKFFRSRLTVARKEHGWVTVQGAGAVAMNP